MSIKHCIVHQITSDANGKGINAQFRKNENLPEGSLVSLFTQLKQALQRSATRQYGCFDGEQTDNPLPGLLQKFIADELGFQSLTEKISEQIKLSLDSCEEPISAHLLFVVEELMEQRFFYLFWINHSDAQYIDSELDINPLQYVDGAKLNYVFKLDFEQWKVQDWQQYITLQMSRSSKEISHAFSHATGFISGVNLQAQTDEFLEIVEQYTQTLDEKAVNPTKNTIVNYCVEQDMQGNPINFDALSEALDDSAPEKFASFVKEYQETPKEEIYAHRNSLKKYVRFYGREKDLSISFSSDQMEDNILYNPETGELTFKQVPKSLKAQLSKYFKKQS